MHPSAPDPTNGATAVPTCFETVIAATPPPGGLDAPAARRNVAPLLDVLRTEIEPDGTVLEIGAGTGQHAAAFVQSLHPLQWLPTEFEAGRLESIRAWRDWLPPDRPRPLPPRALDASDAPGTWPVADLGPFRAVFSVNVIHIAPWKVALGLFAGAAHWLHAGAPLILYGPFGREGAHTSEGNAAFDTELRAQDADWGIRDLERDVVPAASLAGLTLTAIHAMPANNFAVVFRR